LLFGSFSGSDLAPTSHDFESLLDLSMAGLNSLAEVLRQAQPLYRECMLILNGLLAGDGRTGFGQMQIRGQEFVLGAVVATTQPGGLNQYSECAQAVEQCPQQSGWIGFS
jgi:hypothetical protein